MTFLRESGTVEGHKMGKKKGRRLKIKRYLVSQVSASLKTFRSGEFKPSLYSLVRQLINENDQKGRALTKD